MESCPHCGISLHEGTGAGAGSGGGRKLSTLSIVFIVVGCAFAALVVCGGVVIALLLPQTSSREPARRSQCKNNLKQIGLALHNYHDVYGSFPPAYFVDASGKPMHSWRVLILPFLD